MKKALIALVILALIGFGAKIIYQSKSNAGSPNVSNTDSLSSFSGNLSEKDQTDFFSGEKLIITGLAEPVVFIHFWATWCGPCLSEFPELMAISTKFKGKLKILAITDETDKAEIERFLKVFPESKDSQISIISDAQLNWVKTFSVDRLPETYIYVQGKFLRRLSGAVNWGSEDLQNYIKGL